MDNLEENDNIAQAKGAIDDIGKVPDHSENHDEENEDNTDNLRSQNPIIYTFVATENKVVANNDLSRHIDLSKLAEKFIGVLPAAAEEERYIFPYGGYSFYFSVKGVTTYGAVSNHTVDESTLTKYLNNVIHEYEDKEEQGISDNEFGYKVAELIESFAANQKEFVDKLKCKEKEDCRVVLLLDENLHDESFKAKIVSIRNEQLVLDEGRLGRVRSTRNLTENAKDTWLTIRDCMETNGFDLDGALNELERVEKELCNRLNKESKSSGKTKVQVIKKRGKILAIKQRGKIGVSKYKWNDKEVKLLEALIDNWVAENPGVVPKPGVNQDLAKIFYLTFPHVAEDKVVYKICSIKKLRKKVADAAKLAAKALAAANPAAAAAGLLVAALNEGVPNAENLSASDKTSSSNLAEK